MVSSQNPTTLSSSDRDTRGTTESTRNGTAAASLGDIVTVDLELIPENGFVPAQLFDSSGRISFVLGWGNYLPGLHEVVTGLRTNDEIHNVSIDAGYGKRNNDMIIEVPKKNFKKIKSVDNIVVGTTLNLQGNIQVRVIKVTDDTIVVDANHPLAGSSYSCSLKVISIDRLPTNKLEYQTTTAITPSTTSSDDQLSSCSSSPYEIATLAMGCFWGVELAFQRCNGVVGTRSGYTQGTVADPSYQDVCNGTTKHREAVIVVYDTRVVSYQGILDVYARRLAATESQYKLDLFKEEDDDDSLQYKHGLYFHNDEQRRLAEKFLQSNDNRYDVELLQATVFYDAEEEHQQYLYKGGQSSRKNARETIRCYG
jgi:methionine-S-sulfoxide reductase